jgi:8-oxo-dGTP pyrophosphatase MutT (NUDIX family)
MLPFRLLRPTQAAPASSTPSRGVPRILKRPTTTSQKDRVPRHIRQQHQQQQQQSSHATPGAQDPECAGFIVFAPAATHVCLVLDSRNDQRVYGFPKGRIEAAEDAFMAACRELQEETGLSAQQCNILLQRKGPSHEEPLYVDEVYANGVKTRLFLAMLPEPGPSTPAALGLPVLQPRQGDEVLSVHWVPVGMVALLPHSSIPKQDSWPKKPLLHDAFREPLPLEPMSQGRKNSLLAAQRLLYTAITVPRLHGVSEHWQRALIPVVPKTTSPQGLPPPKKAPSVQRRRARREKQASAAAGLKVNLDVQRLRTRNHIMQKIYLPLWRGYSRIDNVADICAVVAEEVHAHHVTSPPRGLETFLRNHATKAMLPRIKAFIVEVDSAFALHSMSV